MYVLTARLCLFVLFLAFASRSHADPKVFLDAVTNGDDPQKITVIEWYIEPVELDRIPAYDPATDVPSVSLADAIRIARSQIDKALAPDSTVTFKTIQLDQIDRGNTGETVQSGYVEKPTGKWYYKVTYSIERPDSKHGLHTDPMAIYVLMDGTISERRERPQTKQEREENDQFIDQLEKQATADAAKKRRK